MREENRQFLHPILAAAVAVLIFTTPLSSTFAQGIVIDHTCTDLTQIPESWINAVQSNLKWHYAHTSHGGQLTAGLERIENNDSRYAVDRGYRYLPATPGALCIYDGMEEESYVTPDLFWESDYGRQLVQNVLSNNPTLNVVMWAWCSQLDYYNEAQVQAYLDAMASFEAANPGVTFVYATGNAQAEDEDGYNRYMRNNMIRSWVKNNPEKNRVLFDFADLDSWWWNYDTASWEQAVYTYDDGGGQVTVPVEHAVFHGDEAGAYDV